MACLVEEGRDWEDKGTEKSHAELSRYMNCKNLKGKKMEALERKGRGSKREKDSLKQSRE